MTKASYWATTSTLLLLLCGCGNESRDSLVENRVTVSEGTPTGASSETPLDSQEVIRIGQTHSYESRYDHSTLNYWVRPPFSSESTGSCILFIGELPQSSALEGWLAHHWLVHIPSRPSLNYQLLAEGDFWSMLDEAKAHYPALKNLDWILTGSDQFGEIALCFANDHRHYFSAVAVSGPISRFHYPNLDRFPVVAFDSISQESCWSTSDLVDRLEARSNPYAVSVSDPLEEAIDLASELAKECRSFPSRYQFSNYYHAQAWPWLRIVGKLCEDEEAVIDAVAETEDATLSIYGKNVSSIEVLRYPGTHFPEGVSRIRFNDKLYVLPTQQRIVTLGDEGLPQNLKHKVNTPSGFLNFWRNEALIIVYQDLHPDPAFSNAVHSFAHSLAHMEFRGLPPVEVELPLIKLSEYLPIDHGAHRAIFVGDPAPIKEVFGEDEDSFPLFIDDHEVYLSGRESSIWVDSEEDLAYALCYSPQDDRDLRLAFILGAQTLKGMQTVLQNFTSATALLDTNDLKIWVREEDNYHYTFAHTFDSYWGSTKLPTLAMSVPPQPVETWKYLLNDILQQETQAIARATEPLISPSSTPPTVITEKSLNDFIPDRLFAQITIDKAISVDILNTILKTSPILSLYGLEDITDYEEEGPSIDPNRLLSPRTLLVDARSLDAITPRQKQLLKAQLIPHTLHELVLRKLDSSGPRFGRELLRITQTLQPQEEFIR